VRHRERRGRRRRERGKQIIIDIYERSTKKGEWVRWNSPT